MAILYYIFFGIWYLLSLLPLRVLYVFSDVIYFLLYHCVRYRRKIVSKNLIKSFPEKDSNEIKRIEKRFYSCFCDYFMETIKLRTISPKSIEKHITFEGLEEIEKMTSQGKSCVVYLAHCFNWEWITSLPLHIKDENVVFGQIYHPLENKFFDNFFLNLRSRYGAVNIPMTATLRYVVKYERAKRPFVIGFISDQVPCWEGINHWVDFMHQDTPVFTGAERIALRSQSAVFYLSIRKKKRGYYTVKFSMMAEDATQYPGHQLTEQYFKLVEKDLHEQPELWLWTHNRWKRDREGYARREEQRARDLENLRKRNQLL